MIKNKIISKGYTFDDLLLIPRKSKIVSRSKKYISLETKLGNHTFDLPIVSANMKTITEEKMASAISIEKGLALFHRFTAIDTICTWFNNINKPKYVGVSIGIPNDLNYIDDVKQYLDNNVEIFCIDVAHGHHTSVFKRIEKLKAILPSHATLIVGNIATLAAARDLSYLGADVVKCGIGSGSICTTRLETGNGVPQMTALMECREGLESVPNNKTNIIADGGIRHSGDIVKALVFADAVMLGNMLAGTHETPGEVISVNGYKYKQYVGSSTYKTNHIEGVEAHVPYKGTVYNILQKISEGIRSGMSYQNASNLNELKENARFIEQSNFGQIESAPHDVNLL